MFTITENGHILPNTLSRIHASWVSEGFAKVVEDIEGTSKGAATAASVTAKVNATADPVIQGLETAASSTAVGASIVAGIQAAGGKTQAQTQVPPTSAPAAGATVVGTLLTLGEPILVQGLNLLLQKYNVPAANIATADADFTAILKSL